MLQGKEVRATRRSVSGGRKIDIATRTLGYSVNDDKSYLERSPPITVRTTAEKGGLEYLSRVTWPRINGREERGTVKFARISEREGGREETNRMEINTRISLWIS